MTNFDKPINMSCKRLASSFNYFWKVAVIILLMLIGLGFAFVFIATSTAEKYAQETNQRLNSSIAKNIITEVKPFINGEVSENATDKILLYMMAINPSIEVYILNPEGKILNYVAPYKRVKLESVNLNPIREFIASKGSNYVTGDDPRNPERQKVFSAAAIEEKGDLQGYVYVVLASEEYESAATQIWNSYILRIGGKTMLIALLGTLILGLIAIWLITKNLNKIIRTVKKFQGGEMTARIPVRSQGGINDLAIAFNEMADTIIGNIENLKSMENLRRELVGNVSHDLRTPIAVIHGYIETLMIKKESISEKEREKYLKIILESTDRLRKLVDDLFELSKLEAKQIKPKKEPFFIQELIQDIFQKFQILASEKGVTIKASDQTETALVYADIGLIERALQNLLDNALKYTPKGGLIAVEVDDSEQYVEIKVSDTGPGIPEDQIPFIFDRYHIGDKRISLDNNNTGLGLAIVKKILEIHDQTIHLTSHLNKGSTFTFQLPQYQNE